MLTKVEMIVTAWIDVDSDEAEQTVLLLRKAVSDKLRRLNVEEWAVSTNVDNSAYVGEERMRAHRVATQIRLLDKEQKEEEQKDDTDSNRD